MTLWCSASFLLGALGGPDGVGILAGALALRFPRRRLGFCAIITRSVRFTGPVGHEAFDGGVRLTLAPNSKRGSSGLGLIVRHRHDLQVYVIHFSTVGVVD